MHRHDQSAASLLIAGLCLAATSAVPAAAAATQPTPSRWRQTLDLRDEPGPKPASHAMVIGAFGPRLHPFSVGHTFIELVRRRADGTVKRTAMGMFPWDRRAAALSLALGPIPGGVIEERGAKWAAARLTVNLDPADYEQGLGVIKRWRRDNGRYLLLRRDCMTFTDEIASAVGLTVPKRARGDMPVDHVRAIYRASKPDDPPPAATQPADDPPRPRRRPLPEPVDLDGSGITTGPDGRVRFGQAQSSRRLDRLRQMQAEPPQAATRPGADTLDDRRQHEAAAARETVRLWRWGGVAALALAALIAVYRIGKPVGRGGG